MRRAWPAKGHESLIGTLLRDWDALAVSQVWCGEGRFFPMRAALCKTFVIAFHHAWGKKNQIQVFNQELKSLSMLYSQFISLLLDIYETPTCFMFHLGLLYREFVGTITPTLNMALIKMRISFCPTGIFYCFNVMTRVGLGSSIVLF